MKIYLINPDYMLYANPPIGLAYLAAYVKKEIPGLQIRTLDQIPHDEIIKIIKKEKPELIGITSVSENWVRVKKLAENIRGSFKEATMVIGGVHITAQPSCFENSAFNYGVLGEGEIPFSNLIKLIKLKKQSIANLSKIKGLLIRGKSRIIHTGLPEQIKNIDTIPFPDLDLFNMKYYTLPSFSSGFKKTFNILTSRGCPYNCKFCSSSHFWEAGIRFNSPNRVVEEMEVLYKKYGFRNINLADDLFAMNKPRIKRIIELLDKKGLLGKIEFSCCGRANLFDDELATLLKKMGITTVVFGFESGSENTLTWLKGGNVTVEDNKKAISICKRYGIIPNGFFMIGSPYETIQDMRKTYNFIKDYCKDNFIIYQTIAYPGTEIWEYAIKEGIIKEDMYEHEMREFLSSDINYLLTKEVSKEDFNDIYQRIRKLNVDTTRKQFIKSIKAFELRNLPNFLNSMFLKKMFNLRYRFLKRVN